MEKEIIRDLTEWIDGNMLCTSLLNLDDESTEQDRHVELRNQLIARFLRTYRQLKNDKKSFI